MDRFNLADILGPAALMEMPLIADRLPWHITQNLSEFVWAQIATLGPEFRIDAGIAVHTSACIEPGAILKPPMVVGPNGFIASGAYLRGGVWLGAACMVGPGVEIKTSILFSGAKIAHFNFIGDSLIGPNVNMEAGSIIANHRNESRDKEIMIHFENYIIKTGVEKFGAVVGAHSCIGANAVLAPGTIIFPDTNVGRLALVDQMPK